MTYSRAAGIARLFANERPFAADSMRRFESELETSVLFSVVFVHGILLTLSLFLPLRLAVNNMQYLSNVLGIKDPIHKQKIALKAMDVVLFGPPKGNLNRTL